MWDPFYVETRLVYHRNTNLRLEIREANNHTIIRMEFLSEKQTIQLDL